MPAPENNVQYVERYSVTKEEENGYKHIIYTTDTINVFVVTSEYYSI
jgi:hypothetical protein